MDEIATNHHAASAWDCAVQGIRGALAETGVHPSRCVVLVPYAQLMPAARAAWMHSIAGSGAAFMPRFESSMNWSRGLGGFVPHEDDLRLDAACDTLTAGSLLERAGLAAHRSALAGRLMEAAWSLARSAAALAPAQRRAWGERTAAALDALAPVPVLALEAALGRLALAWVAHSAYPTDVLFDAQADLLVLLDGLQPEPLHDALRAAWAGRVVSLPLAAAAQPGETPACTLHQALDGEDEAGRAAACVLAHLAQGRAPVALVAQDRFLTRRVRALLEQRAVAVRDETGWTLSTTRAAASLMGLLRAMAWDASTDVVLDWAKNAPALPAAAVARLEAQLRRDGVRDWRQVATQDGPAARIAALRQTMLSARPLWAWLRDLRSALQESGQWPVLVDDIAGQAVLEALRLRPGAEEEFVRHARRIGPGAFVAWVGQVLEAATFQPPHPAQAQVVILPLSQLLGRTVAAVVLPGCDEQRLPASPEPPGPWTPAQRQVLGLPPRATLEQLARATWDYALRFPRVDILWRATEGGERVLPGPFVQGLLLQGAAVAPDTRPVRALLPAPGHMPRPGGGALPLRQLSASAYEDLRHCPYRFFALRQLGLREAEELDTAVDKRDFGIWLHAVLRHFHEALAGTGAADRSRRRQMMDDAATRATRELALGEADFLPFAASWPRVRQSYLDWLEEHEARGASFAGAEVRREVPLGAVHLVGRIDRIDRRADGLPLVIDYKTEARATTARRVRNAAEDTQLPFYAALVEDDQLAAMYLHVSETDLVRAFEQQHIVELRDLLLQGIQDDLQRIGAGVPLPALGAGAACDWCAARGLCRKDFWQAAPAPEGQHG